MSSSKRSIGEEAQTPKRPKIEAKLPARYGRATPVVDRKSVFHGLYLPVTTQNDAKAALNALKPLRAELQADHCMRAWRIKSEIGSGYNVDWDDDGELHGGKKLAESLRSSLIEGMFVCMRQYGGTMLGPVRFNHIVDSCRAAHAKYRAETTARLRRVALARAKTIALLEKSGIADLSLPSDDHSLEQLIASRDAQIARLRST
ncbi:hypothetical protein PYCC9005_005099 [Savitreella phatthalungensis]